MTNEIYNKIYLKLQVDNDLSMLDVVKKVLINEYPIYDVDELDELALDIFDDVYEYIIKRDSKFFKEI